MTQHLLLYTSPAIGGLLQYDHSLLRALATEGYRVTYIQELPTGLVQAFGAAGVERSRQRANWFVQQQQVWGIRHRWLESPSVDEIDRLVTDLKPDLILLSNGGPVANFQVKQSAIDLGIPFIIVEHLVHPVKPRESPEAFAAIAQQYAAAKAVIAVSHNNLELLRKLFGLSADKGQVIYCGRPERYFRPPDTTVRSWLRQPWQIPLESVVCFTAARMDIIKGYQYQLAAMKQLKHTEIWDKLYFAWAGTGTLFEHFQQAVRQAGVADRVKFLGELTDIADWLDASDIFVLPSESEGLPLAMMEAMAKGLPVAAAAVSGVPEGLGETGQLLTSPIFGDSQATIRELVITLQTWVANSQLRQQIGQDCKQRAERLFREDRMLTETIAVVRSCLPSDPAVNSSSK